MTPATQKKFMKILGIIMIIGIILSFVLPAGQLLLQ